MYADNIGRRGGHCGGRFEEESRFEEGKKKEGDQTRSRTADVSVRADQGRRSRWELHESTEELSEKVGTCSHHKKQFHAWCRLGLEKKKGLYVGRCVFGTRALD
jgi:hypothetical protein